MTSPTRADTTPAPHTLTLFAQLAGVWQAASTADRAAIGEVLPDLAAVLTTLRTAVVDAATMRCHTCDHLAAHHGIGGCWRTLTTILGVTVTCPCHQPVTGPPDVTAGLDTDIPLIGWAIHAACGCINDHHGDELPTGDDRAAHRVLGALLAAGRLNITPTAPTPVDAADPAARTLTAVETRLRTLAEALEARGGVHRNTAAGVRLAVTKVAEMTTRPATTTDGATP